jgi:NADPH2:quinone reductase
MKAIVVVGNEAARSLRVTDVRRPEPGKGEVLLRVVASGVNFADTRQLPVPGAEPVVPGFEAAGIVMEVGPNAAMVARDPSTVVVGARVVPACAAASYAEYITVPADVLYRVPDDKSLTEAAALPNNFLTAWVTAHHRGEIAPGHTVLVHAAGGGVGSAAVQLAKRAGCQVIATASSDSKLALAKSLGADHAISYASGFRDELRETLGSDRPVDVVLDSVGGDVLAESLEVIKPWGTYVGYGQTAGKPATLDVYRSAMPYNLDLRFSSLRNIILSSEPKDRDLLHRAMTSIVELWSAGAIRPSRVDVLALEQATEAQRRLTAREVVGKLVLQVSEDDWPPELGRA